MKRQKNKKGFVLLYTIVMMTTLLAISVAFASLSSVSLKNTSTDIVGLKTIWLTEAGIQQAIYELKTDSNFYIKPKKIEKKLGSGSFSVVTSKKGNVYSFVSTGVLKDYSRKISMSVLRVSGYPESFDNALYSQKNIQIKNTSIDIIGNLSARKDIQINKLDRIGLKGELSKYSTVLAPAADFDKYKKKADHVVKEDMIFSKNKKYSGVWFVDGNVQIEGGIHLKGSIVATGNITFKKNASNVSVLAQKSFPALVSQGEIQAIGLKDSSLNGLIYSEKDILLRNNKNNSFIGSFISKGKIEFIQCSKLSLKYDLDLIISSPPYFTGDKNGLSVISQKDWDEV